MKRLALSLTALFPSLKAQLGRLSWFTVLFGFVKLNAFTAALFLSNFVSNVAEFGLFEYALSVGLMAAIPFNFGLQGAYPYFNLKLRLTGFRALFHLHALLLGGGILVVLVLDYFVVDIVPAKLLLALIIGGIVAQQVMFSAILKSHEILVRAVLFDGGLFLVLNGYNLFLWLSGAPFQLAVLEGLFAAYFVALTLLHLRRFVLTSWDFSWKAYRTALGFGRHLVVSAFLIICLSGSARIFIEWFLGLEEVGYYGFYFRFAAVTVLVHQVVNIVFFKKMYEAAPRTLDRFFALFLGGILVLGLCMWQLTPLLLTDALQLLRNSHQSYNLLYFTLTFQMLFWIAMALNENIVYRENLSRRMNGGFLALTLGMTLSFWVLHLVGWLDVFSLTAVNMFVIFLACELQFRLLAKKNIHFPTTRKLLNLSLLAFGIGAALLY